MKLLEIFRYEFKYQVRRTWTLLFFAALLIISFLMTRDGALSEALLDDFYVNSPFSVAKTTVVGTLLWMVMAGAIAGDAAARDVTTLMSSLVYTSPISKLQYLGGRFIAALSINTLLLITVQVGILLAIYLPGVDPEIIGPFNPLAFINAFLFLSLPNAIAATAIQFAFATSSGRPMSAYLGSFMLFFISFVVGSIFFFKGQRFIANMLDIIGVHFILSDLSHNWTTFEKSHRLIKLEGNVLFNRSFWVSVGIVVLIVNYAAFRFRHRTSKVLFAKLRAFSLPIPSLPQTPVWVAFRTVVTSWPGRFLLIVLPLLSIPILIDQMEMNGVPLLPTTIRVLAEITAPIASETSRWVIIPMLIAFFTGELVWRERDAGMNEITDAMPVSGWSMLLTKFTGLCLALGLYLLLMMAGGIAAQSILGYHDYEIGLYLKILFGLQLPEYILFAALAFMIQIVIDQKYIGLFFVAVSYVIIGLAPVFGIEHPMLIYTSGPGWSYTDMRGFGGSVLPWLSFKLYWSAWALLILVVAKSLWIRGKETRLRIRVRQAKKRLAGSDTWIAALAVVAIVSIGASIFYIPVDIDEQKADYEKKYSVYKDTPQLSLIKATLDIALNPEDHEGKIKGVYTLVNNTGSPVNTLHLSRDNRYEIIQLDQFVQPGESTSYSFNLDIKEMGIFENGTFIHLEKILPLVGYQSSFELLTPTSRRKHDLPKRPVIPSLYDVDARKRTKPGVILETIITTCEGQTAVAPGELIGPSHYKTSAPIGDEWPVFSAKYEVINENIDGINLRTYYHPAHTNNVKRLIDGTRASLRYFNQQFGQYPYTHLTLIEHPGNGSGMHADASIISFSEGFTSWGGKPGTLDLPYAVAGHEMGHQWNTPNASVEGAPVMSESVAWYYGIKLVEHTRGKDELESLLEFMHGPYPYQPIRRGEPLLRGLDPYLSYRRGPFALYAMSEYIGEEKVHQVLKDMLVKHRADDAPLATTLDLFDNLKSVTPDSLQYLLHDLFEVNTYWQLKIAKATFTDDQLTIDLQSKKIVADSAGVDHHIPINDWIEIGVYGEKGEIYLKKHFIDQEKQSITLKVTERPLRIIVDPRRLLIDLNTKDNNFVIQH